MHFNCLAQNEKIFVKYLFFLEVIYYKNTPVICIHAYLTPQLGEGKVWDLDLSISLNGESRMEGFVELDTPQPLYNTIVGVHCINRVG